MAPDENQAAISGAIRRYIPKTANLNEDDVKIPSKPKAKKAKLLKAPPYRITALKKKDPLAKYQAFLPNLKEAADEVSIPAEEIPLDRYPERVQGVSNGHLLFDIAAMNISSREFKFINPAIPEHVSYVAGIIPAGHVRRRRYHWGSGDTIYEYQVYVGKKEEAVHGVFSGNIENGAVTEVARFPTYISHFQACQWKSDKAFYYTYLTPGIIDICTLDLSNGRIKKVLAQIPLTWSDYYNCRSNVYLALDMANAGLGTAGCIWRIDAHRPGEKREVIFGNGAGPKLINLGGGLLLVSDAVSGNTICLETDVWPVREKFRFVMQGGVHASEIEAGWRISPSEIVLVRADGRAIYLVIGKTTMFVHRIQWGVFENKTCTWITMAFDEERGDLYVLSDKLAKVSLRTIRETLKVEEELKS